jgi:hypothetical protein
MQLCVPHPLQPQLFLLPPLQTIVMTLESVCPTDEYCLGGTVLGYGVFDIVETFAVAVFTLEYVLRVYAAPELHNYRCVYVKF